MGTDRRVEYMDLDEVLPAPRNAKNHATEEIARSIGHFGVADLPTLDDRTGRLVAGHGRINDLRTRRDGGGDPPDGVKVGKGGRWQVPVVRGWASRSDEDAEAYLIASNHLTTLGGWDDTALAEALAALAEADLLDLTGFTADDLAALLETVEDDEEDQEDPPDPDDVPAPPRDPITQPGDVWLLGPHRVIAGDCRDWATVERLLDGRRVNVAFTSPPYAAQRTYDPASGFRPIPPAEYVDWFEDVQANVRAVLADDGSWFVNIKEHCEDGQRHLYVKDLTIAHVRRWGWRLVDEFAWTRSAPPGRWPERFKNGWEPIFHYAPGSGRVKFRPESLAHPSDDLPVKSSKVGANTSGPNGEYWNLSGETTPGLALPSNVVAVSGVEPGTGHTAAFPVRLVAWFILGYSDKGDAVLDPFMGSGTMLVAAHAEGRVAYGCEISPAYVDVICRRFEAYTGIVPVLESTGAAVSFVAGADLSQAS